MRFPYPSLLLFLLCAGLPAQAAWLVGPGGVREIREAVALAAPGDLIYVLPGAYAHFEVDRSVSILGVGPGVQVAFDPTFVDPACNNIFCLINEGRTSFSLTAAEQVRVTGIDFVGNTATIAGNAIHHRIEILGGTVTLEDCTFTATDQTALTVTNARLHAQGISCTSATVGNFSASAAMILSNSTAAIVDSQFRGGGGFFLTNGPGIQVLSSTLTGSRLALLGGPQGSGLSSDNQSTVWLSDSSITGNGGACPLFVDGQTGGMARCTLIGGAPTCNRLPTLPLLGVQRGGPVLAGQPFSVVHTAQPGAAVGVFAATDLAPAAVPQLAQLLFTPLGATVPVALSFADANGRATTTLAIPATAPAQLSLWITGVAGSSLPLQVAPAVGGVVR